MKKINLAKYEEIVGPNSIEELAGLARALKKKAVQNINTTASNPAVVETLTTLVPLMRELGVDARWDTIEAPREIISIDKAFDDALLGRPRRLTNEMFKAFLAAGEEMRERLSVYGDVTLVHDIQLLMLAERKRGANKWVWHCHIDVSHPDIEAWTFLKEFVEFHDASVFASPGLAQDIRIPRFIIPPSIDPFGERNRPLADSEINKVLKKYGITRKKPIVLQVARFDYLKDPIGVIDAWKLVKKYIDCTLVLAGDAAAGDPDEEAVYNEVLEKVKREPDIRVVELVPQEKDLDINALQRAASCVVQKSIREGFCLTVTEALWKGKAVVASDTGGIPLQIKHKYSGLLCHSITGAALQIRQILNSPEYGRRLGENARQHVRANFLSTRQLRDYLLLFLSLCNPEDIVHL